MKKATVHNHEWINYRKTIAGLKPPFTIISKVRDRVGERERGLGRANQVSIS